MPWPEGSMGTIAKSGLEIKKVAAPDETRAFAGKGRAEIFTLESGTAMRGVFEPGWRWSEHVKPIAGTKSCEAPHLLYILSGRMHIKMDDGTEGDIGPGDFVRIAPGHDAWVVGDEVCQAIDFGGFDKYAKSVSVPASTAATTARGPAASPPRSR
jgi:hypothetical protein